MNGGARYDFEWDPAKAKQNLRKHGVSFERAATVFLDPNTLSIFDAQHGSGEDRWITLGMDRQGVMLVVSHTFREADDQTASIRIITSRKATRTERRQYEKQRP
jgi:uncharacterized DUF497 family protein